MPRNLDRPNVIIVDFALVLLALVVEEGLVDLCDVCALPCDLRLYRRSTSLQLRLALILKTYCYMLLLLDFGGLDLGLVCLLYDLASALVRGPAALVEGRVEQLLVHFIGNYLLTLLDDRRDHSLVVCEY